MTKVIIPAVTRTQMKEVDRLMIEEYAITLLQMMENAGRNLAELARQLLKGDLREKRITILCGGGNNGGGGMAAARHLANWGADVQVALSASADKLKEAPRHQLLALGEMGVPISEDFSEKNYHLIIDALIGYGLRGAPQGKIARWINLVNKSGVPILSLDIPSGLNADRGYAQGACIQAQATLTLALPKKGLMEEKASAYAGDVYLADISVPSQLLSKLGIKTTPLFSEKSVIKIKNAAS